MDPVPAYLEYLREMARKIAYRGTFLNVLHRKSSRSPDRYLNWDDAHGESEKQRYLVAVEQDIKAQDGRSLFIGIGLLVGRLAYDGKVNLIAAPLLLIPVELERGEEVGSNLGYDIQWGAVSLNYDLITAVLERSGVVDPDDFVGQPNQISPAAGKAVNDLEVELDRLAKQQGLAQRLCAPELAEKFIGHLHKEIPSFRDRVSIARQPYRKEDLNNHVQREGLMWFNHRFAFMGAKPNALSAYEALNELCSANAARA